MAIAKPIVKKPATKNSFSTPHLNKIQFTKLSSSRAVEDTGLPRSLSVASAHMRLTVALGCNLPPGDNADQFAITVSIQAEGKADKSSDAFYTGEVAAVGFLNSDPKMSRADLEAVAFSGSEYLSSCFDTVYAIAANELGRLIQATGLPAPSIPLNLDGSNVEEKKTSRKKIK